MEKKKSPNSSNYDYNRFNSKGKRVGQAVHDILSTAQPIYSCEEILEQMGEGVMKYIVEAVELGCKQYSKPFYILHLFKKELGYFGVSNVVLQKATIFENRKWTPLEVMNSHPHPAKTLYEVDPKNGTLKLVWTVPSWEECKSIILHPEIYDKMLVGWAQECMGETVKRVAN